MSGWKYVNDNKDMLIFGTEEEPFFVSVHPLNVGEHGGSYRVHVDFSDEIRIKINIPIASSFEDAANQAMQEVVKFSNAFSKSVSLAYKSISKEY